MADSELGIIRKRRGKGFEYFYVSGRKVQSGRVLDRLSKLVIPPNWQNVRIATNPSDNLQATGYDAKNRKQYIYHPKWHEQQQALKFERLSGFGSVLPEFRQYCWGKVEKDDWTPEKTLSLICLLLDHTGLRIGNRNYTQQNNTYGLTTLRRKHVQQDDDHVTLSFVGKHNKPRNVEVEDGKLADLVAQSAQERGYALFRYEDRAGRWHDIDSDDVNQFIHDRLGAEYSCKDFRTWGASRFALFSMPEVALKVKENKRRSWPATLTSHVASMLGNTPTVCRQYYLHPNIYSIVEKDTSRAPLITTMSDIVDELGLSDASVSETEKVLGQIIGKQSA
ncbi:DNA topoisomerase IB [Salinimonas iocasae]|uniref:DNA topoisomerase n=1 Tax=Salinimonas iocasae TaxID=2572577 RepID=A0A5B7YEE5_9ALTE|nr:DNA topoisomerase IB [Salinimonas iocasae]QCZ93616.1 DNA topoisomerase IB [Salinimonas iocasae]